eukprot:4157626-Amphidinium_carterae.1
MDEVTAVLQRLRNIGGENVRDDADAELFDCVVTVPSCFLAVGKSSCKGSSTYAAGLIACP